jgi:hypothetical protein
VRRTTAFLMLLFVGAGSSALADEPAVPADQIQPAPAAAATSATSSASVTSSAPVAPAASVKAEAASNSDVTAAQLKAFRQAGYKPEVHNGQTIFCRREAQLGTRFESKVCGTAADIARSTANSQELAERIQTKAFVKAPGSP